ncbi:MAG: helix-hairpin-helix domain-containing protein, partial [Candidatus Omnitrophica bacterium]|nr:helix-hairpin-helix domain-containing protein [Candidatus Omnitrophota bacterium]
SRISAYHREHGPFTSKEELLKVEGIGQKKFEQLKDLIILE